MQRPLARHDYYESAFGPSFLLVLFNHDSVAWLEAIFEEIATASVGTIIDLAGRPEVDSTIAASGLVLLSSSKNAASHLRRARAGAFIWSGTTEEWRNLAMMLEPFADKRPGHQYLTSEGVDDALIEVSFGEPHTPVGPR